MTSLFPRHESDNTFYNTQGNVDEMNIFRNTIFINTKTNNSEITKKVITIADRFWLKLTGQNEYKYTNRQQ